MDTSPTLRRFPPYRLAAIVIAGIGLSSCSSVKVKLDPGSVTKEAILQTHILEKHAGPPPALLASLATGSRKLIVRAKRLEVRKAHKDAAAHYLKSAVDAERHFASGAEARGSDAEKALIELHNHSLSRFVELWMDDPRRDGSGTYRFDCEGETIEITLASDSTYKVGYFDRAVASLSVKGTGVISKKRDGWGASLVGIRDQTPERAAEMKHYPKRGLHAPVTLTMDSVRKSEGLTRATFSLRNPMLEQTMQVGSRTLPVAADFSAPVAVVLNHQSEQILGLEGFFDAKEREKVSGIYLHEPYDPNRIPVLLIHGLISVPMIWRDILPEVMSDPEISKRYQVMLFAYPSGISIVESAKMLRNDLAAMRKHYDPDGSDPLSRNMVVAGHSMGGILTHTLVVEMGNHLWEQISSTPFDQLEVEPDQKERIRSLLFFKPDPAVHRAFYFSAPHRGAHMAEKGIVKTIAKLAKLPFNIVQESVLRNLAFDGNIHIEAIKKGGLTSAHSLRPGAPMVAALDVAPYRKGVTYHSVMGDRGKGDTPNSSDGVVEYWSSRQDGAASELIVPTDHKSYKHPKAIDDLKRVLREHAGSGDRI